MNTALLSLLQISDPALPIGGYSHSSGLETYVQKGLVHDVASAKDFVTQMLVQNLQYTDAAFMSLAYDAARKKDLEKVRSLDEECSAVKLATEVRTASQKLCMRLCKIFELLLNDQIASEYFSGVQQKRYSGHFVSLLAFMPPR